VTQDGNRYEDADDGWRHCERCGEGFTLWFEKIFKDEKETNGYYKPLDMTLCDECWKQATEIGS